MTNDLKPGSVGNNITSLFPKTKPDLPPEFRAVYETYYKKNRQGETAATSLSSRMEHWLHLKVAKDVKHSQGGDPVTLEIGAGTLNQLPLEPHVGQYDIVEPFGELYRGSPHLHRIRKIYNDISDVPVTNRYDRITAVAAFEHILNLPEVVAKGVLLMSAKGSMRVSIPNEGTILWKLGTLITGFEFKRMYGLDYQVLMHYEHVNTADEIEAVMKYFFRDVFDQRFRD